MFAEADVYAIGTKLPKKSATPSAIVEEAYKYVIENTFAKLNMLKATPGEVLRELQAVLVADDIAQIGLDLQADECNPEATREVEQYVTLKSSVMSLCTYVTSLPASASAHMAGQTMKSYCSLQGWAWLERYL